MARLIDAYAIVDRAIEGERFVFMTEDMMSKQFVIETVYSGLADFIMAVPEAVVRCKNCKKEWCYMRQELGADGFCSAGERKCDDI